MESGASNGIFLKILVIGEVNTGKTSLVRQFVEKKFEPNYRATIGCDYALKVMEVDGQDVQVQIWDIAGQDRLGGISKMFCRDAKGAIIVSDLTEPVTLEKVSEWKRQVDQHSVLPDDSAIPMVLLANKIDKYEGQMNQLPDCFTETNLAAFSRDNNLTGAHYTSAKTGENVNESITSCIKEIIRRMNRGGATMGNDAVFGGNVAANKKKEGNVKLGETQSNGGGKKKKSTCC